MNPRNEIRYGRDGYIDFDFYRTRATILRREAIRNGAKLRATFRFMLFQIAALVVFATLAGAMGRQPPRSDTAIANGRLFSERQAARLLRKRIDTLANSDPQKWWDGYGKSTARGQTEAIAELIKQLGETPMSVAARRIRERVETK